ncbi:recombinase family protein [Desulfoluna spongiiphila]|uniref:Recombinase n=1 Tax=Desulfoluna spongiiphila TaxID=419481 RepID=A0A1G5I2V2_9BACT|nr:recombinase family protein [Desulfoluna spongiiphila]SCY70019.1 Recombinase [Desulfoluna spongiiphila]
MSDFLQSIRNQSKDKRYQHNNQSRRPYDNSGNGGHSNHHNNQQNHHSNQQQQQYQNSQNNYHHHRNNDNQNNNYHRNNNDNRRYHQRPRNDFAQKDENLGLIKELLETMVTQQGQAMEIHERRAIEEIASIISSLAGAEFPAIDKVVSGIDAVAREFEDEMDLDDDEVMAEGLDQEEPPAAELSKDEIVGMIHKMRAQGSTYNEVAAHLTELGLPTFSGRGKWHAQTIHRLCQQDA